MYEVKMLKDNFQYKKGEIIKLSNVSVNCWVNDGICKVIRYLGNFYESTYFLEERITRLKLQIENLQSKLKYNEDLLIRKEQKHGDDVKNG